MGESLFTYGTLLFPEVMEAVTGRSLSHEVAVLRDFSRQPLAGAIYPGIAPVRDEKVRGTLFRFLDPSTLELLDGFEGDLYERCVVEVEASSGRTERTQTYVVVPRHRSLLLRGDWDPEVFRAEHLEEYVIQCRRFRWQQGSLRCGDGEGLLRSRSRREDSGGHGQ